MRIFTDFVILSAQFLTPIQANFSIIPATVILCIKAWNHVHWNDALYSPWLLCDTVYVSQPSSIL